MAAKRKDEDDASDHSAGEDKDDASNTPPPPAKKPRKAPAGAASKKGDDKRASTSKAKASKASKGGEGKGVYTSTEGDKYIDLGKKKRVTVRSFKGMTQIDIREFYGDDGDEKPGKKGISLNPEQWAELRHHVATIDELVKNINK